MPDVDEPYLFPAPEAPPLRLMERLMPQWECRRYDEWAADERDALHRAVAAINAGDDSRA